MPSERIGNCGRFWVESLTHMGGNGFIWPHCICHSQKIPIQINLLQSCIVILFISIKEVPRNAWKDKKDGKSWWEEKTRLPETSYPDSSWRLGLGRWLTAAEFRKSPVQGWVAGADVDSAVTGAWVQRWVAGTDVETGLSQGPGFRDEWQGQTWRQGCHRALTPCVLSSSGSDSH